MILKNSVSFIYSACQRPKLLQLFATRYPRSGFEFATASKITFATISTEERFGDNIPHL
jgi:hypothetical protein